MKRNNLKIALALLLVFSFGAALNKDAAATGLAPAAQLEIVGPGIQIKLNAQQMQDLLLQEFVTTSISSSGDIDEEVVAGFSLNDLLAENGVDMAQIASLNFSAADGYMMAVPAELWAQAPVFVLLYRNGESLKYPTSSLPDQRAMYWVRELVKIEATLAEKEMEVRRLSFFKAYLNKMAPVQLDQDGMQVDAYSLQTYFENFVGRLPDSPVSMIARDGFQKTETPGVFLENYITFAAGPGQEEDLPLYFAEGLQLGMRVKKLHLVIAGEEAVFFGEETPVSELFSLVGMAPAANYKFLADDGWVTTVPADAIAVGRIFWEKEGGHMQADFSSYEGLLPRQGIVKHLIAAEAVD